MTHIFISYASPDSVFALRLAQHVMGLGHTVWIDQWEIGIGDPTPGKVIEGLERADYLIVVVSQHTLRSAWVEREVQIIYYEEITQRRTMILPVIIEDCIIPTCLRLKRFADFRAGYEIGLAQLAITLHASNHHPPISSYQARVPDNVQVSISTTIDNDLWYTGYMFKNTPRLSEISVDIGLPYIGKISGKWEPKTEEQEAAWELYIELITRISVAELRPDEGLLRESLSSLYTIFTSTRDILRKHGPSIAQPKPGDEVSFGYLAVHVLNFALRPVLAKWHPLLLDYEHNRDPAISPFQHDKNWEKAEALRGVLNETRRTLITYTNILAQVAGVPQLVEHTIEQDSPVA